MQLQGEEKSAAAVVGPEHSSEKVHALREDFQSERQFTRHKNRQPQSPRHRLSVSAERQSEGLEKGCTTVGLRDVGLHRARIPGIEAYTTRLGSPSTNDAFLRFYMERVQDAGNMGTRAPPQFHVHGNDFSDVLVRC